MEGSASAPTHPQIELEPPEWQPRALRAGARGLCGAVAFFMVSFVFAYFYLRAQDPNRDWKIGHVAPSFALGLIILLVLVASAVLLNMAARRPELTVSAGGAAVVLALLSIVLQVIQWTTLGFGPESGGYASVFVGWTAFYAVLTLACAYWIETQVATAWRRRREDLDPARPTPAEVMSDTPVVEAGLEACSFFWTFYVANGFVLFVLLYVL
jgi:heme/copper-type cytochrome/quinol oxidase subunit 3